MNRRALLKAAAAAAMVPGISQAQDMPNGFQAAEFDGGTYLVNPGTDPSLALPASATSGLIAYSYRATVAPKPYAYGLICGIFGTGANDLWLFHTTRDDPTQQYVQLIITNDAGLIGLEAWAPIAYDGNWYTNLVGFDAGAPTMDVVSNGRPLPVTYQKGVNGQGSISFGVPIYIGGQGGVLGPDGVGWYKGCLADVWGCFGQTIDAADPKTIAGFWDVRHQEGERISADGQSAIRGIRPNFFLSGDVGKFLQNGPSSIGHYSLTSSAPQSPFTVGAGALRQPDSDPWNYAVVGTSAAAATARVIGARRRLGTPVR